MVILHSYVSLPEGSDWCFTLWVYSDIIYSKDGIVTDGTLPNGSVTCSDGILPNGIV